MSPAGVLRIRQGRGRGGHNRHLRYGQPHQGYGQDVRALLYDKEVRAWHRPLPGEARRKKIRGQYDGGKHRQGCRIHRHSHEGGPARRPCPGSNLLISFIVPFPV